MQSPTELPTQLCIADETSFWAWYPWTELAAWADKPSTTIVLPLCGLADWGLEAALDAEETVALSVLREAARLLSSSPPRLLTLPPQRFVLGPSESCAFPVDPDVAHATLEEWCTSVAAAGFRRIVLYNSSPWNEELIDAAARDLRIAHGVQMFCVNLSALGLDFAPWRAGARERLRALLAELARSERGPVLHSAAKHLASLLAEIAARPALPDNGALRTLSA
jgi:hypothetical protein